VYNYNFAQCDDGHKRTLICQDKGNVNGLAKGFKAIHMSQASIYYYESTNQKLVLIGANRLLMWKLEKLLVLTVKVSSVSGVHSL
jgi:hypothetical protein